MHDKIVFHCECGASLGASKSAAGRRGKCKHCGQVLTIPGEADSSSSDVVEIIEEFCSICQTTIEQDEEQTRCEQCSLPFHEECWEENLGCSAYGCSNVNVLKAGPDLRISSPPPLPRSSHGRPLVRPQRQAAADTDIPWEYLILAGSALALLFGLSCFGLFSLVALAGSVAFMVTHRETTQLPVLVLSLAISGVGFIFGIISSLAFYF